MTDPTPSPEPPPPASQLIHAQRNGAFHGELTDAIAEAAARTMATGKTSKVQVTLTFAKAGKGGHQFVVSDQVTSKLPQEDKGTSFFFFDAKTNGLLRKDPLQAELPLQEVPRPTPSAQEA